MNTPVIDNLYTKDYFYKLNFQN